MDEEQLETPGHFAAPTELEVIQQVEVPFLDELLLAALGADGEAYIPVTPFAERLGLERARRQLDRIRRDDTMRPCLRQMAIQTAGGKQQMQCLRVDMLALWLTGIRENMVKESVRAQLSWYKREAAQAIINHFRGLAIAVQQAPTMHVTEGSATYHEAMILYHQQQRDVALLREQHGQRLDQLEQRIDRVEQLAAMVPEIATHYRLRPLSDEHQATVQACVKRRHELTQRSQAAIYEDLKIVFHVAKYDRIPEERWGEVAHWFRDRIRKAGGKMDVLDNEQGSMF